MSAIEDIKSRIDIVELIGQTVSLKKAGRNFKGLCPFHQERTPSFIVFPESQHFHCFGCGASGDAFAWVMRTENVDFAEALRILARRAGVVLRPPTPQEQESDRLRRRLLEIHLAAARFFQNQLLYGEGGAMARGYLEQRGLTRQTIDTFLLGYAPDRWDALYRFLREKGYGDAELSTAGLIVEREHAPPGERSYYDRFRNRLIFPIRDPQGQVIGFGGRALAEDQQPKYLNSPQTPLFDKGAVLYGLDQAAAAIRREGRAILVEGYFDVIVAHQYGFQNVVAPMGTALTPTHVHLLKRLTQRLFLALDADAAGAMAMQRGFEVIREAMDERAVPVPDPRGLVRFERELDGEVRIVVLPAGRDPDEVIRADPKAWEERVAAALPVLEYVMEQMAKTADLSTARGKSEAVRHLLPFLAEVHDPVQRAHYVQRLAHLVQVDERAIQTALRGALRPRRSAAGAALPLEDTLPGRKEDIVEGYLLALLHRFPVLRSQLPEGVAGLFSQEQHRALWELFLAGAVPEDLPGELRDYLQSLLVRFDAELALDDHTARRALEACLGRLQTLANERQRREFQDVLAQAQDEGNRELAQEVFRQLSVLSQRRWELAMPPPRRLFPDARRYLGGEDESGD